MVVKTLVFLMVLVLSPLAHSSLKIGFLDELYLKDGKTPSWGMGALNGLKLALVEENDIEVIGKDVGFSPIRARNAAEELIKKHNVDILVGLRIANQAMLVKELALENKVPYISIMATPNQLFSEEGFTFSMAYRNSYQIDSIVNYIKKTSTDNKQFLSFVTQDCFYCVTMEQELQQVLKKDQYKLQRGGTLLHRKAVSPDIVPDVGTLPDYIALFTDEIEALSLIQLLVQKGYKGTVVGGDSWSLQSLQLQKKKDITNRLCLVNSLSYKMDKETIQNKKFKKDYKFTYKTLPTDLSALGHDVGLILKGLQNKCQDKKKGECLKAHILAFRGKGVTGPIGFETDGGRKRLFRDLHVIGKCK